MVRRRYCHKIPSRRSVISDNLQSYIKFLHLYILHHSD
nr:MAG TPA: hypothetical protein [Caudoviricetes sp.]